MKTHTYTTTTEWTGNLGSGTSGYREYSRDHLLSVNNKSHSIEASSDPSFLGDSSKYNPEELLVSSLSSCHMLWYLHLCSENNIRVLGYKDTAKGTMEQNSDGSGRFVEVLFYPEVEIDSDSDKALAKKLHDQAHKMCFIANSCNFDVKHEPKIIAILK